MKNHPLRQILDKAMKATVNSDDPAHIAQLDEFAVSNDWQDFE